MRASVGRLRLAATLSLLLSCCFGCLVNQRPGAGERFYLKEGTTGGRYWLYLPDGYAQGKGQTKYPLVVTFHGMKPFDDDSKQINEWQQEADRYGYVVCAPSLKVSAFGSAVPLSNPENSSLKRDERAVVAILDELYRTVEVDPNHVMVTSFSYGGYVAHYMFNRHPERFHCLAVKQSNFNEALLDPKQVPRYRDRRVGIFCTENDLGVCQRESRRAAEWYAEHGFDVTYAVFEKRGHERTPSLAAEFFARVCGASAKSPPVELARLQVTSQPEAAALARVGGGNEQPVSNGSDSPPANARSEARRTVSRRWNTKSDAALVDEMPVWDLPPRSTGVEPLRAVDTGPVRIRVSATVGVAPMLVSYSAVVPNAWRSDADYLWTHNGQRLSSAMNGQTVFTEAGVHDLEVIVTGQRGQRFRARRTITVLDRAEP